MYLQRLHPFMRRSEQIKQATLYLTFPSKLSHLAQGLIASHKTSMPRPQSFLPKLLIYSAILRKG
jgi:hypothetical protein